MTGIGINGFGRIGKCCFLQLIDDKDVKIKCVNAPSLNIREIEDYLRYDSTHKKYNTDFTFEIISDTIFKVNHHIITLVSDRNPKNISWRKYGCSVVIEATGAFLTTEKCLQHDVDYVIISSPAKDNTPTYVYGVNENKYLGERIISAASCTTNCLAPMLHILSNTYGIKNAVFTTIHSSTASQNTVDIVDQKARTSRSIFNNIIPHTTGASSAISFVLPNLVGKVFGTSVRVPIINCSLLDLNIELDTSTTLDNICNTIKNSDYYKKVYDISYKKLVSSDYFTTETPCILDVKSSIDMGNGKFKLMVWYDNEWSYSTQIIRLIKDTIIQKNKYLGKTTILNSHFIENMDFYDKQVVCRFDYNVPIVNGEIVDDFRIFSTIQTIKYIMSQNPKYIVLVSHLGRPKGRDNTKSLSILLPILEQYLDTKITFLDEEIGVKIVNLLKDNSEKGKIYLLENIRFYEEETNYETMSKQEIEENNVIQNYMKLGDTFICDAFGCMHRKHMSIHAISQLENFGYGYLVKKELENISGLVDETKKKLVIIGGNKIKDKMPFIDLMKIIPNTSLFVGGKIATEYELNNEDTNITLMIDGYGAKNLTDEPMLVENVKQTELNVYDIGQNSLQKLYKLIDDADIIFWNGALGVIENVKYVKGSLQIISYLLNKKDKIIVIGGGDTSSLIDKNKNIYVSTGGGALLELLENINKKNGYLVGLDIFTE